MTNRALRSGLSGFLFAVFISAILGVYPPATRGAYADGVNASFIIIFSLFFRGLSMAVPCWIKGERLFAPSPERAKIIWGGFFQAVTMICLYQALVSLPGALVLIIFYTFPFLLWLYLVYRKETAFRKSTVAWILLALGGLSFVVDVWGKTVSMDWIGIGLCIVASAATVARMRIYGKVMEGRDPVLVGAENFMAAWVFSLVVLFWQVPVFPHSVAGYGWVALSFLSSIVGSFGIFYGVARIGSFKWSLFGKMEPVFVALFSYLLLDETLRPSQYFGIMLVLGSLVGYQLMEAAGKEDSKDRTAKTR